MKRIQAGADLHLLHLVHRLSLGEDHADLVKRRAAVREGVLDDQILCLLGVDEGSDIGFLRGNNRRKFLDSVLSQHLLDRCIRSGRDLVNHGPGEGHLCFVIYISFKSCLRKACLLPCFSKGMHSLVELVPVVGAVVCADHGDRFLTGGETLIEKRGDFTDIALRLCRTFLKVAGDVRKLLASAVYQAVALFRDGKGSQLKAVRCEDLFHAAEFRLIFGIQDQGLRYAADDRLFHTAV